VNEFDEKLMKIKSHYLDPRLICDPDKSIVWMIENVERMYRNERDLVYENVRLARENKEFKEALEKISDPRKRDHSEPDDYTTVACLMHIANEALIKFKGPTE